MHKVLGDSEKSLIGVERPPYDGRFWTLTMPVAVFDDEFVVFREHIEKVFRDWNEKKGKITQAGDR